MNATRLKPSDEREEISLNDAATHVLEECRTVVPGMQALFGFQLIAVFSTAFDQQLSPAERWIHLAAIVLVTIAIVLVMAPAALHRQTDARSVSQRFITVSSRLLMSSMVPLAIGICLDVYLVARVIVDSRSVAGTIALLLLAFFILFWFVLPRAVGKDRSS
jgi:uncharacterized protein DUF6328